ncbi:hypothetical protein PoB_005565200 [Plakobranchus ocellatus]|uniref:Chitin-binding type-4 domain-containing protein n=1 Tax=Plakobranchus ocellatus TaxID=259542 RepID=A0AAV4CD76_9GAST|nr:hypothetical protein PoB_005565200 [Plakobranchus ocellatus]
MQWTNNGGRCGICGDPWSGPRDYERPDGRMVQHNITTQTYLENESIQVTIQLTQNHKGWFEFRLCDVSTSGGVEADQQCLDRNLLADDRGNTRFDSPPDQTGIFEYFLVLPRGLVCSRCVLQWKWKCGNNWGCDDSSCGVGKGESQEEFYACSDIKIESRSGSSPVEPPTNVNPRPNNEQPRPIPPQPRPAPSQPGPAPSQPRPAPSQPRPAPSPPNPPNTSGGRSGIPEGYSTYSEYLQNIFATSLDQALKFTNKVKSPEPKAPKPQHTTSTTEQFDRQYLQDVIGYPAPAQRQTGHRGNTQWQGGLPSWMHRNSGYKDAIDRLCAACIVDCRFSVCAMKCPRQC